MVGMAKEIKVMSISNRYFWLAIKHIHINSVWSNSMRMMDKKHSFYVPLPRNASAHICSDSKI